MKIVCVGDAFITPDMMREGVAPFLKAEDSLEVLFWGQEDREAMRETARLLETGHRDSLPIPALLPEAVKDADLLIVHLCPVTGSLLDNAPRLKAVLSCRGGMENLDVEAATERGIIISNNPAHNANAVAEYTLGLILCETRNICRSHFALKNGQWRKVYPNTASTIRELKDLTVGVVGFGSVGRLVAEKLHALGCRILVSDPFCKEAPYSIVPLDELLQESDVVTLHARAKGVIIGERELEMLKPTAVLINTARAHLVDTLALKRSLDRGRPLSVALDVFDTEPDIPGFLREYDNVTITSHRAGDTINSYKDAPAFAMDNYLGFLEGKPLRFRVN
ncbi:MAG: hypothetical protein II475_02270 [Bacteroidales bacterium]|nr:hypothetical protein [Bacteroidales bacterium]MBQ4201514.1 hypothetical protein [Bacteroidales bacterium]